MKFLIDVTQTQQPLLIENNIKRCTNNQISNFVKNTIYLIYARNGNRG